MKLVCELQGSVPSIPNWNDLLPSVVSGAEVQATPPRNP
jgi:hypothetical protein